MICVERLAKKDQRLGDKDWFKMGRRGGMNTEHLIVK